MNKILSGYVRSLERKIYSLSRLDELLDNSFRVLLGRSLAAKVASDRLALGDRLDRTHASAGTEKEQNNHTYSECSRLDLVSVRCKVHVPRNYEMLSMQAESDTGSNDTNLRSINEESNSAVGFARPLPTRTNRHQHVNKIQQGTHQQYREQSREQPRRLRHPTERGQKRRRLMSIFTYSADVSRGGESETTNQSSTHVGQDVSIKVGHDHNTVSVRCRVLRNLWKPLSFCVMCEECKVHTCKQTLSRRSSSYAMPGYSFATWRQADKNIPSDIFLLGC